jgi:hypothetical protein
MKALLSLWVLSMILIACGESTYITDGASTCSTEIMWCADFDEDGFGDRDNCFKSCRGEIGYISDNIDDCAPYDEHAYPGSSLRSFYWNPIMGRVIDGYSKWDYNCDGKIEFDPILDDLEMTEDLCGKPYGDRILIACR